MNSPSCLRRDALHVPTLIAKYNPSGRVSGISKCDTSTATRISRTTARRVVLGTAQYHNHQWRPFSSTHVSAVQRDALPVAGDSLRPNLAATPINLVRRPGPDINFKRKAFIKRSGKRRFVDPEAETKQIAAYCTAEQYSIPVARRLLKQEGFDVDPFKTALYPQVIHVQTPGLATDNRGADETQSLENRGDLFVFPSGTIVTWNVPEAQQQDIINRVLPAALENPHLETVEMEHLEYLEDDSNHTSRMIGDTIILGVKPINGSSSADEAPASASTTEDIAQPSPELSTILAKVAFSSGLARSTKLAVLENQLTSYFASTRTISTILSRGSRPPFTRSFILRKTGELLSIRAQLNLYSELTDEMPDLFWDSPSSLGLGEYYDDVGLALDVPSRIRVLNEKIDYAGEIATVLRERLSEKHSTDLEWLIIFLISVEVVFELWRIWRERKEMNNPESTEALMREYLLRDRQRHDDASNGKVR